MIKKKELVKDAGFFVGMGVGLPVSANVVSSVGGDATPITTVSGQMPMLAGLTMMKHTVSALDGLSQTNQIGVKNDKKKRRTLLDGI